jgi:hypothetical protein
VLSASHGEVRPASGGAVYSLDRKDAVFFGVPTWSPNDNAFL